MSELKDAAIAMMTIDGASVSFEEDALVVTCKEVTDGTIEAENVFDVAYDHNIQTVNAVGDLEAGTLEITFVEGYA